MISFMNISIMDKLQSKWTTYDWYHNRIHTGTYTCKTIVQFFKTIVKFMKYCLLFFNLTNSDYTLSITGEFQFRWAYLNLCTTRSNQRTPPRLWQLTLACYLDPMSRSKRFMSFDVEYCIAPWYWVWCL